MIKVIRTLYPENNISFDDICSFKTENFVGIYEENSCKFIIMPQNDYSFRIKILPQCNTLDELDNTVYYITGERITEVSECSEFEFIIRDQEY